MLWLSGAALGGQKPCPLSPLSRCSLSDPMRSCVGLPLMGIFLTQNEIKLPNHLWLGTSLLGWIWFSFLINLHHTQVFLRGDSLSRHFGMPRKCPGWLCCGPWRTETVSAPSGLHSSLPVTCDTASLQLITWKKRQELHATIAEWDTIHRMMVLASWQRKSIGWNLCWIKSWCFSTRSLFKSLMARIPCKESFRQEVWLSQESSPVSPVSEISGLECGPVDSLPALFTGIFAVIAAGIANAFGRWWEAWLKGLGLIAFTVDFWIHKSLPRWLLVYCLQSMLIWTSILDVESGRRTPDTPKFFLAILPPVGSWPWFS